MEQNTHYRYEAKNDMSYNALAAYVIDLNTNVSLFPGHKVIIIDGYDADGVDKFITEKGLNVFISPIEIKDDNILELVNTATVDADTLRKVANRLIEKTKRMADDHNNIIAAITAENEAVKKKCDHYRDSFLIRDAEKDRIKEQIQAIGSLIAVLFPKA